MYAAMPAPCESPDTAMFDQTSCACAGGSATPGGTSGQVQFNNAGAFGGLTNGQLPGEPSTGNASAGNIAQGGAFHFPIAQRTRRFSFEIEDVEVSLGPQDLTEMVVAVNARAQARAGE